MIDLFNTMALGVLAPWIISLRTSSSSIHSILPANCDQSSSILPFFILPYLCILAFSPRTDDYGNGELHLEPDYTKDVKLAYKLTDKEIFGIWRVLIVMEDTWPLLLLTASL